MAAILAAAAQPSMGGAASYCSSVTWSPQVAALPSSYAARRERPDGVANASMAFPLLHGQG
jgi:hypothetical protein